MWWPERKLNESHERLKAQSTLVRLRAGYHRRRGGMDEKVERIDALLDKRKGVESWPDGAGKNVALKAIDGLLRESLKASSLTWPEKSSP